jgi:hypothetical protein
MIDAPTVVYGVWEDDQDATVDGAESLVDLFGSREAAERRCAEAPTYNAGTKCAERAVWTVRAHAVKDIGVTDDQASREGPGHSGEPVTREVDDIAREFHLAYEWLAEFFGYETRPESQMTWSKVPEANKRLMWATVESLLGRRVIVSGGECELMREDRDALLASLDEMVGAVEWWDEPNLNVRFYRHRGCDESDAPWTVPLDDTPQPARETEECARCCTVLPLRERAEASDLGHSVTDGSRKHPDSGQNDVQQGRVWAASALKVERDPERPGIWEASADGFGPEASGRTIFEAIQALRRVLSDRIGPEVMVTYNHAAMAELERSS